MQSLEEKIRDKSARVGIVGTGYVGLPQAITFEELSRNLQPGQIAASSRLVFDTRELEQGNITSLGG